MFYLQLRLVDITIQRFVEYTLKKGFNGFLQSAFDAGRKCEENSNSSGVAEIMELLVISFYDYQIMDRSRHTMTKNLNDEKTHAAINSKLFMKLNHVNNAFYETEFVKAEIEHKESILVDFFSLQYAKIPMLELYYNFSTKFCGVQKLEELEMDTDYRYLVLAEKELEDCI